MTGLLDLAVITIFARETLEGGIIIGEYRTVILRTESNANAPFTKDEALRAINKAALFAAILALVVCAAVAIPLAILSRDFNDRTAIILEGVSKIVASICILQLSMKMPKFFGLYKSRAAIKREKEASQAATPKASEPIRQQTSEELASPSEQDVEDVEDAVVVETDHHGLTLRSIWFNVSWNIWREVAECGVFLIPFFLTGDDVIAIPLSAVVGIVVGGIICMAIYIANQRLTSKTYLTVFTVLLLVCLAAGLFSGGVHKFEIVYGFTHVVYRLRGQFWSVNRLPMTILKPFGYSDVRTVLQMFCYWGFWFVSAIFHYRKYKQCRIIPKVQQHKTRAATEVPAEDPSAARKKLAESLTVETTSLESDIVGGGQQQQQDPEAGIEVTAPSSQQK